MPRGRVEISSHSLCHYCSSQFVRRLVSSPVFYPQTRQCDLRTVAVDHSLCVYPRRSTSFLYLGYVLSLPMEKVFLNLRRSSTPSASTRVEYILIGGQVVRALNVHITNGMIPHTPDSSPSTFDCFHFSRHFTLAIVKFRGIHDVPIRSRDHHCFPVFVFLSFPRVPADFVRNTLCGSLPPLPYFIGDNEAFLTNHEGSFTFPCLLVVIVRHDHPYPTSLLSPEKPVRSRSFSPKTCRIGIHRKSCPAYYVITGRCAHLMQ